MIVVIEGLIVVRKVGATTLCFVLCVTRCLQVRRDAPAFNSTTSTINMPQVKAKSNKPRTETVYFENIQKVCKIIFFLLVSFFSIFQILNSVHVIKVMRTFPNIPAVTPLYSSPVQEHTKTGGKPHKYTQRQLLEITLKMLCHLIFFRVSYFVSRHY